MNFFYCHKSDIKLITSLLAFSMYFLMSIGIHNPVFMVEYKAFNCGAQALQGQQCVAPRRRVKNRNTSDRNS